jgi:hypothetical protein
MSWPVIVLMMLAVTTQVQRSRGYAGSTPVGLDGHTAFTSFDCTRINADPRRSRVRVPLAADCRLSIPAPRGRLVARTEPAPDGTTTLHATGGLVVRGLDPPTVLLWNPDGSGFLLNGGEGSGQVSNFRYFFYGNGGWRESRRLGVSGAELYRRRFDCRRDDRSYFNTSGWNWSGTRLRVIVQEGVHSEGCLQPHKDRNVLLEMIGDPVSGRIVSARETSRLP